MNKKSKIIIAIVLLISIILLIIVLNKNINIIKLGESKEQLSTQDGYISTKDHLTQIEILKNGTETGENKVENSFISTKEHLAQIASLDNEIPNEANIVFSGETTQTKVPVIVTAQVTQTDNETGVNISSCKWEYNTTSTEIGTDSSNYTGTFSSTTESITLETSAAGTYYLHVLTVDNVGNKKETIKGPVTITAQYHAHTGSSSKGGGCYTIENKRLCGYFTSSGPISGRAYCTGGCGNHIDGAMAPANIPHYIVTSYSLGCNKNTSTIDSYKITY